MKGTNNSEECTKEDLQWNFLGGPFQSLEQVFKTLFPLLIILILRIILLITEKFCFIRFSLIIYTDEATVLTLPIGLLKFILEL